MAARAVRVRGLESPYAKDQVVAFVLHPIIAAAFVVLSALSLRRNTLFAELAPFLVLNVAVAAFWGYVSWADPAGAGGCRLRRKGATTRHYCSYCRKTVEGFDHHCSWLNTCISARNYGHFYFLGVAGSALYLYMTSVGVLVLIFVDEGDQRDGFGSLAGARAAWGIFMAAAGWVAVSFIALAGFHTYLLFIGLGTYDWVVLQNQKRQAKLADRRNRPQDAFWVRCCRKARRRPAIAMVQEGSSSSPPTASVAPAPTAVAIAKGRWGGAAMGMGVTPIRSQAESTPFSSNNKVSSVPVSAPVSGGGGGGGGGGGEVVADLSGPLPA